MQEIKNAQKQVRLLIPRSAFARLVKEIVGRVMLNADIQIQSIALVALQKAVENAMVMWFEML